MMVCPCQKAEGSKTWGNFNVTCKGTRKKVDPSRSKLSMASDILIEVEQAIQRDTRFVALVWYICREASKALHTFRRLNPT